MNRPRGWRPKSYKQLPQVLKQLYADVKVTRVYHHPHHHTISVSLKGGIHKWHYEEGQRKSYYLLGKDGKVITPADVKRNFEIIGTEQSLPVTIKNNGKRATL